MPVGAYAVASDTGRRRRRNEDNYVVAPPLFAVADGMGGAQAGEVASQLAASVLEGGDSDGLEGPGRIDALIQEANRRIYDRASTDPSASGMGTTMTVAIVEGMTVAIGHVGDSRAYLVRGERMEQLTEDHSLVNELLKSGKLSQEEAHVHPQRSVITRAVGTDPDVDVDGFTIEAEDGDVFGMNHRIQAGGAHAFAAGAEQRQAGLPALQRGDQLRSVGVAGSLAGGEQDAHKSGTE